MKALVPAASRALERFTHAQEDGAPVRRADAEAAILNMLTIVGLPERRIRWFETAAAASAHLATAACEATARARNLSTLKIDTSETGWVLVSTVGDQVQKRILDAAESAFDAGWANGWVEIFADCEIAAGRSRRLGQMQSAFIELQRRAQSPEITGSAEALAQVDAAMAAPQFNLRVELPAAWARALSPDDFARLKEALGDNDELRDTARGRVLRHRTDLAEMFAESIKALAVEDVPPCQSAQSLASHVLDAWEAGVRVLWVRPSEIVLVPRA